MQIFRFKKFNVVNERSAMKVNTDGVLLGAAMTLKPEDSRLLDIGTGTGTIALMAAQRLREKQLISEASANIHIDAIDIDEPSASEAQANFDGKDIKYDQIFSNPPYFEDSLTAPDERKSIARHTSDGLSYRDIFHFAQLHLSETGRVSLVLPADQEAAICRYARMCDMHLFRILRVRTVPRKAPSRIIVEFSAQRSHEVLDSVLTIQNEGQYTQEYLSLTKDFYLFA